MRSLLFTLVSLFCIVSARAQTSIKLDEVSKHIGDSVTVCGKVADMRYFENSNNKPTLINMGAKHPNGLLTLVIWEKTRALFNGKVEDLMDKEICVTGRIILYKEKPEIIIEQPGQVVIQ